MRKYLRRLQSKTLPNMREEIATQVSGAQSVPYRINPKENTPRHILIKVTKIKQKKKKKKLKVARVKHHITYIGIPRI